MGPGKADVDLSASHPGVVVSHVGSYKDASFAVLVEVRIYWLLAYHVTSLLIRE